MRFAVRYSVIAALAVAGTVAVGCAGCSAPSADSTTTADDGQRTDSRSDAQATDGADGADGSENPEKSDVQRYMDSSGDASTSLKKTTWGSISGACGAVAAQITSSQPSFLVTTFTFDPAAAFTTIGLSPGAKKRYAGGNAGGSSLCSEVMSMQLLHECEGATLYKTETEITYTTTKGAITDYETTLAGHKVGVSVTRAYRGPNINVFTRADAIKLLKKKLAGVLASSAKISAADKWTKQILHIWTLRGDWVSTLRQAWQGMDAALKADTVVLISIEVPATASTGWIVPDDCGL